MAATLKKRIHPFWVMAISLTARLIRQTFGFTTCLYIHTLFQAIPFIYILMSRKSTDSYTAAFNYINDNIFELNAASFMTDYECGMRTALALSAELRDCWFHYCQAIRRKCSKIWKLFSTTTKG